METEQSGLDPNLGDNSLWERENEILRAANKVVMLKERQLFEVKKVGRIFQKSFELGDRCWSNFGWVWGRCLVGH
jgi:hypothetical protein